MSVLEALLLKYVGWLLKQGTLNKHQSQALAYAETIVQIVQRRQPAGNWQLARRSVGNGQPIMIYMLSGILASWQSKVSVNFIDFFRLVLWQAPEVILVCLSISGFTFLPFHTSIFPLSYFQTVMSRSGSLSLHHCQFISASHDKELEEMQHVAPFHCLGYKRMLHAPQNLALLLHPS